MTTARDLARDESDEPESISSVRERAHAHDIEAMRAVLRRAPRLVLNDEERAEWDEAERSAQWVPHDEAMAILRRDAER
jgi:hypothetical protein